MQHRLYGLRGQEYVREFKRIFQEEQELIREKFLEIKERNGGKFSAKNLGEMCNHFQLPVTVIDAYLSDLGLLPVGTWDRLKDRGAKARDIGVVWK